MAQWNFGQSGSGKAKKKSIFANVQDLAGITEKTAEILDLSTKNTGTPACSQNSSHEGPSFSAPAPFVHHPMPLMAQTSGGSNGVATSQSMFLDYTLNLCQMVELATAAQHHTPFHGHLPHHLCNPIQPSLMRPFFLNPMTVGCPAFSASATIPSSMPSPGGAVLMLSPRAGSLGETCSPNSPPETRSQDSGSRKSGSSNHTRSSQGYGRQSESSETATALQLPAHPPSTLSLLGSGKSSGLPRQAPRFQCPDCNRSYSTFSGLSKHRQFHCTSQMKRQFACKFCEKQYSSLGALKMHIRTHTLPCKCQMCGKAFSRPWLLQGHLRTHTGEKPFRCGHCGRAFADRSNLRAHLQTHSEIKKYRCKTCQKTFSRMSLLTKHETNGCPGLMI